MKRGLLTLLVALTAATGASAQDEARGITTYSSLGLGIPVDYRAQGPAAMGTTGISSFFRLGSNAGNPALWSQAYFTTGSGGMGYRRTGATDRFGSATNAQLDVYGLQIMFPILRETLGASFSMQPITEVSYGQQRTITTLPNTDVAQNDTIRRLNQISGSGGLNRLELGFGWNFAGSWSIGYAPSMVFGTIRRTETNAFLTGGLLSPTVEHKDSHLGFGNRFGLQGQFRGLFRSNDILSVGATYSMAVDLNPERTTNTIVSYVDLDYGYPRTWVESREFGAGSTTLPSEIGVGLTYYPDSYWTITSEAIYQDWANSTAFGGGSDPVLRNRLRVGFGGQYAAALRTNRSFWNHFLYRAGVSYDTGHLELGGTSVSTLLFTTGVGIPSRAGGSSIDLNFEFGLRGTTSHDLVRERIFGVRMAFNLSEMMFFQRKLD